MVHSKLLAEPDLAVTAAENAMYAAGLAVSLAVARLQLAEVDRHIRRLELLRSGGPYAATGSPRRIQHE
jgi:hypothetical protein